MQLSKSEANMCYQISCIKPLKIYCIIKPEFENVILHNTILHNVYRAYNFFFFWLFDSSIYIVLMLYFVCISEVLRFELD